jgi:putative intracellular protease/amidase
MSRTILVIVSNHGELGGEPNGTYAPELTHALHVLEREGIAYELASPRGGPIPLYGTDADPVTRELLARPDLAARLADTKRLAEVDPDRYAGVFFPGGYGLLFDLVEDPSSLRITAAMARHGRPIAAVCHGPAALSAVVLEDGRRLVAGKHVTGFTREEEVAMKTLEKIPFLLEERMIESGAIYQKKAKWQVLVVTDGALITGQNPGSATGVGEALAAALRG